jgi:hypothetical protein
MPRTLAVWEPIILRTPLPPTDGFPVASRLGGRPVPRGGIEEQRRVVQVVAPNRRAAGSCVETPRAGDCPAKSNSRRRRPPWLHGRCGEEVPRPRRGGGRRIRTQTAAQAHGEQQRQSRGRPGGGCEGCSDFEPAALSKTNQIVREIQKSEMSSSVATVPSKINLIDREMNSSPECRSSPESPWTTASWSARLAPPSRGRQLVGGARLDAAAARGRLPGAIAPCLQATI